MIKLSIRRPVAVTMTYTAVALLGVAAWQNIPIELLPDTQLPQLTITSNWRGASPEVTEAFLTSPLEAAVQQVRGVTKISSQSSSQNGQGQARITVEFDRETDMDFARLELSEMLIALDDDLPPDATIPNLEFFVPREFEDQNQVFMRYTVTGPFQQEALRSHLEDIVSPEMLQVEGIADVSVSGGRERVLRVELNLDEMRALNIEMNDVRRKISDMEHVSEAGLIYDGGMLRTLAIRQKVGSADEVRNLVVSSDGGRLVRLMDIANIRDTYEDATSHYRIDAFPAVTFSLVRDQGTNVVAVAEAVKARVARLDSVSAHPPGVRLILDVDQSEDVKKQLTDLRYRAAIAAVVIFGVLLVFLRSFVSAGIVFATIAFAILIALNLIYFGGLTLNVLTLMGLAMGFGLIVDNAIVVLENIYRRRKLGEPGKQAAEKGAGEVVLPILAATATTLIVFIPFVYLQGELRVFYVPLAIVVGMSLLASLFVAFSFIPALASRTLGGKAMTGGNPAALAEFDVKKQPIYVRFYAAIVGFTSRFPIVTVIIAGLAFGGSYYLFDKYVNRGILWGGFFGQSTFISINIRQPRGAELERTDEMARFFEERLREMPEIEQFTTNVLEQAAFIRVTFPDSIENTQIPVAIKEQLVAYSHLFGGVEVRVYGYGPSFYGGGGSAPNYTLRVLGYNYITVREIAIDLQGRLERFSRVRDVNINAGGSWWRSERVVEYAINLDRPRMAAHNLSAQDVVTQVSAAVGGRTRNQSRLNVDGEELIFDLKFDGHNTMDVHELNELLIYAPGGSQGVRLGEVAAIGPTEVLNQIDRENQQYTRSIRYEFRGPAKLGDRVRDAVVAATDLPEGYEIVTTQDWRWGEEEQAQIYMVLGVSLILIFMVTAALFESLKLPLTVLLTVPMALIGVFLMFFYTNASFTREAYIGVIMMGGIVVNNAILLVDHINQLRRKYGLDLREAVIRGTLERVRPILMTSATTILGLLPLVLFSETADANIWNALGYALIGGLLSSTFLVLTVTPALYTLFERRAEKRRVKAAELKPAVSTA